MRKLDCHRANELIVAGLDEGLDEGRAILLQEHIDQCPACRLFAEETRRVLGLVAADLPTDPGEDFWRLYQASLAAKLEEQEISRGWGLAWKALGAAAAAVVVVVALYSGIFSPSRTSIGDGNQALAVLEDLNEVLGPGEDEELASLSLRDMTASAMASQYLAAYVNGTATWFEVEEDSDNLFL